MPVNKVYKLTKAKHDELVKELEFLNNTRKKEIEDLLKEARAFGDLSENAEYEEAKNEQGKLYSRITEIDNILSNHVILDGAHVSEVVDTGCRITVEDLALEEREEYQIVGSQEASPMDMLISDESPFGQAVLGKRVGDEFSVETPSGEILKYKIIEIKS